MPAQQAIQVPTQMARPPSALPLGHAVPSGAGAQGQPPGAGLQAQAGIMLVSVLRDLQVIVSMLPTGSNEHKKAMRALTEIGDIAPAGQSTAELTIRQLMHAANQVGRSAHMGAALQHAPMPSPQTMAPVPGV